MVILPIMGYNIIACFGKLWKEKNYKAIVSFAERLPEGTVQEDPNLLMYYDISLGWCEMKENMTDSNIQYIVSTLAIEGLTPSNDALELCRNLFDGKIDEKTAEDSIFEKYGLSRVKKHG